MNNAGATGLHVKPNRVCVNKQSNRRARVGESGELPGGALLAGPTNVGRVRRSRHPATEGKCYLRR
ncbi:hypothetical protein ES815_15980 [Leclercia adecarboxylata]|uniref:Uncharacterized protein n=1 Tax=Leclercia adecarboxylata TaxID=83655 RepID=A0AAP9ALB9_9ENTR|nr:hypothetical protein ES815_15980 [Leclercia adecarboxylata]